MSLRVPVRLREKGQITIPYEIREQLDLKEGDLITIDVHPKEEAAKTQ